MPNPPTPDQMRDLMPYAALIGIKLVKTEAACVRGELAWSPDLCTAGEIMHGGALMSLADSCGGVCAFLNMPPGATGTGTIESKTNFMRPARGGIVTATARPLHKGRTLIVVETELTRDDGALIGKVIQTQAYHYPRT